MADPIIPVFGSSVGAEELAAVAEVMERQWLGFGPKVEEFEKRFAARLGLSEFAMVDSGSNALYLALHLLAGETRAGTGPGSAANQVVLPSFTWVACAHAVALAGFEPVFCDVELGSANVSRATVEPHISERTAAVMVVHYAGRPVDLAPIMELGKPVIEDAAHAVDSRYRGEACGGIAEFGIFSFDAVKNLSAGEGGGLTVREPRRMARARALRYCGIGGSGYQNAKRNPRWWEQVITEPFIKMLPTDLGAAIALAQLAKLDRLQALRAAHWDYYERRLAELSWVERPLAATPAVGESGAQDADSWRHSYFTYLVQVPERDALAEFLLARGIYTTLRYHPLHLSPPYAGGPALPNTETLARHGLNLPLHPRLSRGDIDRVVEAMAAFGIDHGF